MRHDRKFILRSLEAVRQSPLMQNKLIELFPQASIDNLISALNANLLSDEQLKTLSSVSPVVVKINNNLWLVAGNTTKEFDLVGDGCSDQRLVELQNITVEKNNGQSYSMYVSTTDWLEPATPKEIIEVKNFLDSL